MRVPVPKPPLTPQQRMMAAWRASVRPPREDVTGRYHVALAELAGYVNRDVSELLDEWAARADAYAYDGHVRSEAERLAYEDMVRR